MLPPPPAELPADFILCVAPPTSSKLVVPVFTTLRIPAMAAPSPSAGVLAAAPLASRKADPSIGGRLSRAHWLPRSGTTVALAMLPAVPDAMAGPTVNQLEHLLMLICPLTDQVAAGLPLHRPPAPDREKLAPAMMT